MSAFTPAETAACCRLIEMALREDFGDGASQIDRDPTSTWCYRPTYNDGSARFVARTAGIVAGLPAVALVCGAHNPEMELEPVIHDGQAVQSGDVLARVRGPILAILGVERTALNFLQHLSGIASLTHQFVQAVSGLPVKILDTRKTIPGWRLLAKYAVRRGGGHNHRMGLYDGVLIKDNHLAYSLPRFNGSIASLMRYVSQEISKFRPGFPIEIEVESLVQLDAVLPECPCIVLLDNMPLDMMREAVRRRNAVAPNVQLEASGGVTLQTVRAIAETGVDRISIGALTHSAPALDIALDYRDGE
jgi:nicotinate-nucleotide pyrophosphorylase (carboxylating)